MLMLLIMLLIFSVRDDPLEDYEQDHDHEQEEWAPHSA
jgi:hypothetical protein